MTLTLLYSLMSVATAMLIVCMLQDTMTDSHILFRVALVTLAAGCLATALGIWAEPAGPSVWRLMRAAGLLGVLAMMRLRQIRVTAVLVRAWFSRWRHGPSQ